MKVLPWTDLTPMQTGRWDGGDWVDISVLPGPQRAELERHLKTHHPALADLLASDGTDEIVAAFGAEIWIEKKYLPPWGPGGAAMVAARGDMR